MKNSANKNQEQEKKATEIEVRENQNATKDSASVKPTRSEQVRQRAESSRKAALNRAVEQTS